MLVFFVLSVTCLWCKMHSEVFMSGLVEFLLCSSLPSVLCCFFSYSLNTTLFTRIVTCIFSLGMSDFLNAVFINFLRLLGFLS